MTVRPTFWRYELRTTDTRAAFAFYSDLIDVRIRAAESPGFVEASDASVVSIAPLPERAIARGAPAHWLGHIGALDVEDTARRIVALGGEKLGAPMGPATGAASVATLRDPFGSVIALTSQVDIAHPAASSGVVWHELHTRDRDKALFTYGALFGWCATESLDLGLDAGPYQMFAWGPDLPSVGGMINSALSPHIHPHWLFYFRVRDIDDALVKVRSRGGKVIFGPAPFRGARIAPCEDAQGAIFALHESTAR